MRDAEVEVKEPAYNSCYKIYWKERVQKTDFYRQQKEIAGVTLFENDNKLSFGELERTYFKPKNKPDVDTWWSKLRSERSIILSFKNGRANLYMYSPTPDRRKGFKGSSIWNISTNPGMTDAFVQAIFGAPDPRVKKFLEPQQLATLTRDLCENILKKKAMPCHLPIGEFKLREVITAVTYPVVGEFLETGGRLKVWEHPPEGLTRAFRKHSVKECCQMLFGKKATPKVVKLAAESMLMDDCINFDNILLAYIAKPLLSGDYLQEILSWEKQICTRQTSTDGQEYVAYDNRIFASGVSHKSGRKEIREFLSLFPEKKRLQFLREVYTDIDGPHLLLDTIRMVTGNNRLRAPGRIRGLRHLHDDLALQSRKLKEADYQIDIRDLKDFEGVEVGEFTLHFPTSKYELLKWSTDFSNCISTYARDMKRGGCVLLALHKGGSALYHVMVDPDLKCIQQFYGRRNSPAFPPHREVFENWLVWENPFWTTVKNFSTEARKEWKDKWEVKPRPVLRWEDDDEEIPF